MFLKICASMYKNRAIALDQDHKKTSYHYDLLIFITFFSINDGDLFNVHSKNFFCYLTHIVFKIIYARCDDIKKYNENSVLNVRKYTENFFKQQNEITKEFIDVPFLLKSLNDLKFNIDQNEEYIQLIERDSLYAYDEQRCIYTRTDYYYEKLVDSIIDNEINETQNPPSFTNISYVMDMLAHTNEMMKENKEMFSNEEYNAHFSLIQRISAFFSLQINNHEKEFGEEKQKVFKEMTEQYYKTSYRICGRNVHEAILRTKMSIDERFCVNMIEKKSHLK